MDGNLITSRKPDDLPAFTSALLEAVNHGVSSAAAAAEAKPCAWICYARFTPAPRRGLSRDARSESAVAQATWKERLARPIWKSSMTVVSEVGSRPRRG